MGSSTRPSRCCRPPRRDTDPKPSRSRGWTPCIRRSGRCPSACRRCRRCSSSRSPSMGSSTRPSKCCRPRDVTLIRSRAGHGLVPVHTPVWQVSVWVQALPSLQLVPFAFDGFEHAPVALLQTPRRDTDPRPSRSRGWTPCIRRSGRCPSACKRCRRYSSSRSPSMGSSTRRRSVADPRVVALIRGRAGHGVGPCAHTGLAGVRLRAGVAVVAGSSRSPSVDSSKRPSRCRRPPRRGTDPRPSRSRGWPRCTRRPGKCPSGCKRCRRYSSSRSPSAGSSKRPSRCRRPPRRGTDPRPSRSPGCPPCKHRPGRCPPGASIPVAAGRTIAFGTLEQMPVAASQTAS